MISKVISSNNSTNLAKYILDGEAHNNSLTNNRNLTIASKNVDRTFDGKLDSQYTASQFLTVQQKAQNKNKKVKAYHLVFSFSNKEFPLPKTGEEMHEQARQAGLLVYKFLDKDLPKTAQFILGVQRDGDGQKLHVHVNLNAVQTNGKVIDTKALTWSDREKIIPNKNKNEKPKKEKIKGLKSRIDDYMLDNFEAVTGREYKPIEPVLDNLVKSNEMQVLKHENTQNKPLNSYLWKEDLKEKIYKAYSKADSLNTFENELNKLNVTVKKRKSTYTKDDGTKAKREAYTYYFTDKTGKQRRIKDFSYRRGQPSGLGKSFTPESIEREYENAKNITRQQFQNDVNQSITEYSEQFEQSNGINSENISTGTRENRAGTTRENSRASTKRSEKSIFEDIDTEGLTTATTNFEGRNNVSTRFDKLANVSIKRRTRTIIPVELFKPNLDAIEQINRRLLKKQREQRKQHSADEQKFNSITNSSRRINKHNVKHFESTRPDQGTRNANRKHQEVQRGLEESNETVGRTEQQKTIDEPNPFDDEF